ncbi:MAG: sulfotransferase, partial [Pseudomonadota bacterium]
MSTSSKGSGREKTVVLVTGMHRSGTSALTRVLNLHGAQLSNTLLVPVKNDNDTGFWESQKIMELHDEILDSLDSSWSSLNSVPEAWFSSGEAKEYRVNLLEILEHEYTNFSLAVVKDPRIARFVPFWESALAEIGASAKYVICVRNPLEIAASLAQRNGFSTEYSLGLWFKHLDVLSSSISNHRKVFVSYEDLLSDHRRVLSTISKTLDINLTELNESSHKSVGDFLDLSLKHHTQSSADFHAAVDVPENMKTLYAWLEAQVLSNDGEAKPNLILESKNDSANMTLITSVLGNINSMEISLSKRFADVEELNRKLVEEQGKTRQFEQLNKDLVSEKQAISGELQKTQQAQSESQKLLRHFESRLAEETNLLAEAKNTLEALDLRLLEAKSALEAEQSRHSETLSALQASENQYLAKVEDANVLASKNDALLEWNETLAKRNTALDFKVEGLLATSAWRLGTVLSSLIRRLRASWVGMILLWIKALLSLNLKNYWRIQRNISLVRKS